MLLADDIRQETTQILRRILSKMAANDFQTFGDTWTVADPSVVNDIVRHR
jgi:acetyl-CoA synthetase